MAVDGSGAAERPAGELVARGAEARRGRAAYMEREGARLLRSLRDEFADHPEVLRRITDFLGGLILELHAAEIGMRALRKEAEALRQRREDLLERIPLACVITDAAGVIGELNRQAALELNTSRRLAIDRGIDLYLADRSVAADLIARLPQISAPVHAEVSIRPRERRARKCRLVVQRIRGASRPSWRWFFVC
jgi:hypothetical protein